MEQRKKIPTHPHKALKPRGSASLILPCWSGAPTRKPGGSIQLSAVGRQVALATAQVDLGWKLKIWTFCLFLDFIDYTSQRRVR